jgi:hypothetical protein
MIRCVDGRKYHAPTSLFKKINWFRIYRKDVEIWR